VQTHRRFAALEVTIEALTQSQIALSRSPTMTRIIWAYL
jgi:hypothetical protein